MEEQPSRAHLKRPLPPDDEDDSNKPPAQKRVRFPKGKKVKPGKEKVDVFEDGPSDQPNPRRAAKERAKRRNQLTVELLDEDTGMLSDISAAEVPYEGDETDDNGGIPIDPFTLDNENEEGYFDEAGNFVEYIDNNEIKDAWLDSVEVDHKLAKKGLILDKENGDDFHDLSSEEIGKMKRRIADVLEPGETILQALRRLKGTSNNKKEKMSSETKILFDQLTEDAMKLMENGDFNVYEEKQEVFEREAEGYERLARARGDGPSNGMDFEGTSSVLLDTTAGPNASTADILPSNGDDMFDMFAEDDQNAIPNPISDGHNHESEEGSLQNDYVYDESSGYYYSSSLGYYYDPSSGLYCCATSGQWYSYNEATSSYEEIREPASGSYEEIREPASDIS